MSFISHKRTPLSKMNASAARTNDVHAHCLVAFHLYHSFFNQFKMATNRLSAEELLKITNCKSLAYLI